MMHLFYLPPIGIVLLSLVLAAGICLLLLPGLQEVARSRGLLVINGDQSTYPAGLIWFIATILPFLLFSQFLGNNQPVLVYVACALIILYTSLRADLLKVYTLQWILAWFVIAILMNDLGGIKILESIPGMSGSLGYWLGLVSLFVGFILLHRMILLGPKTSLNRSWWIIPSLAGAFIFLLIIGDYRTILLPGAMIGTYIALMVSNIRKPYKQFDPGTVSANITLLTLIWITLTLQPENQIWFLICWLVPAVLVLIILRKWGINNGKSERADE